MANSLRIRPRARADMLEIWTYVASESERSAEKILRRLGDVFETLREQQELGRRRPELGLYLRSFPVGSYVVFYEPKKDAVDIVRVLNGHRDINEEMMRE